MAKMIGFVLELSVDDIRAIHEALGASVGSYSNASIAEAASNMYSALTPFADEEIWE